MFVICLNIQFKLPLKQTILTFLKRTACSIHLVHTFSHAIWMPQIEILWAYKLICLNKYFRDILNLRINILKLKLH